MVFECCPGNEVSRKALILWFMQFHNMSRTNYHLQLLEKKGVLIVAALLVLLLFNFFRSFPSNFILLEVKSFT